MAKRFEVECVSEATGTAAFLMFTADDAEAARRQANGMGYAAGAVIEVPAVSPPGAEKSQSYSKQPTPRWERAVTTRMFWVAVLAVVVIVLLVIDANDAGNRSTASLEGRFKDEFAPGATANSLDRIERVAIRQESLTRRGLYVMVLCTSAVVVATWPRKQPSRDGNP